MKYFRPKILWNLLVSQYVCKFSELNSPQISPSFNFYNTFSLSFVICCPKDMCVLIFGHFLFDSNLLSIYATNLLFLSCPNSLLPYISWFLFYYHLSNTVFCFGNSLRSPLAYGNSVFLSVSVITKTQIGESLTIMLITFI